MIKRVLATAALALVGLGVAAAPAGASVTAFNPTTVNCANLHPGFTGTQSAGTWRVAVTNFNIVVSESGQDNFNTVSVNAPFHNCFDWTHPAGLPLGPGGLSNGATAAFSLNGTQTSKLLTDLGNGQVGLTAKNGNPTAAQTLYFNGTGYVFGTGKFLSINTGSLGEGTVTAVSTDPGQEQDFTPAP